MKDQKGSFYLIESILAIAVLLIAVLVVNSIISIPSPDYSYESKDIRTSQDIMELLSKKVNFTDQSFLGEISIILKDNRNSKKSIREISDICQNKLDGYKLTNYKFCENNKLKGKVLASSGNFNNADKVSVATRSYGDYSYTLYVW
ncbi:hypothetical protein [Methanobrevibacter sp.]|uniref:hypothetical protein n=1 Tax=Methanobrevibacter sp. TaxID=66852 RepID=UPI00388E23A7